MHMLCLIYYIYIDRIPGLITLCRFSQALMTNAESSIPSDSPDRPTSMSIINSK
jgi:hypothetical protein